jgi:hypothetical protein
MVGQGYCNDLHSSSNPPFVELSDFNQFRSVGSNGALRLCFENEYNFRGERENFLAVSGSTGSTTGEWQDYSLEAQYSSLQNRQHFGPELGFAIEMISTRNISHPENVVGLAKFATGSTSLQQDWNADCEGPLLKRFLEFCKRVQVSPSLPQPVRMGGLFWLQGESDSGNNASIRAYSANLQALVHKVRESLGEPELPFVASKIYWRSRDGKVSESGKKAEAKLNAQLEDACTCMSHSKIAVGLNVNELSHLENDHLDSRSLVMIGRCFWQTIDQWGI